MFRKHMLCFVFVAFGFVVISGQDYSNRDPNGVYSEIPCLSQGGLCTKTYDCPKGSEVPTKGLCPVQQKSGVECCYSLPISETRCRKRGGECMPKTKKCADKLTFKRATDCASNEKCCILV